MCKRKSLELKNIKSSKNKKSKNVYYNKIIPHKYIEE